MKKAGRARWICPKKRLGGPKKVFEKTFKKRLTNGKESGILCKLSARASEKRNTAGRRRPGSPKKKFKKFLKKGLTNAGKSAILSLVPLRRRAPCKLNNVTKRKRYTKRGSVKLHKAETGGSPKGRPAGGTRTERGADRTDANPKGTEAVRRWGRNGNRAFKKFRRRGLVNYLTTERDRLSETFMVT